MVARALIVTVEEYPGASGIAQRLEGTSDAGDAFRAWFLEAKHGGVDPGPSVLRYCGSPRRPGVTDGATRNEILDAMGELVAAGKDKTSELYVFFSGHGVAFQDAPGRARRDVLIASDFVDLGRGGRASILLASLQEKVQEALGPGEHYYFVDACRTVVGPQTFTPLPVDNTWAPSFSGIACVLTLYSARSGARASVRSGFAEALVAGLRGRGKAKAKRDAQSMAVTFDRLSRYVKSRVPDQEPGFSNPQGCEGVLGVISPIPRSRCRVAVQGVDPTEELTLVVSDPNGDFPDRRVAFRGLHVEVPLSPNDYDLRVVDAAGGEGFRREEPPPGAPVDLWDDRDVAFAREVLETVRDSEPKGSQSWVRLRAPRGTLMTLFHEGAGKVLEAMASDLAVEKSLGPGDYHVEIMERGSLVARREFSLEPGEGREIVVRSDAPSSVRDAILARTGNDPRASVFEVSESLGPFADAKLGLLLSLIGAIRIVEPPGHFEKLGHLPLETFADAAPGASAVYVLSAFDHATVDLALHEGPVADWHSAKPVGVVPGLSELRMDARPGAHLLSFRVQGRLPTSLATCALANRATLVTLSQGEDAGEIEIHQYLLPLYGCRDGLDPSELDHFFSMGPLRFVRLLWHVQNLFAMKRRLAFEGEDEGSWLSFSLGKWLDPMMGVLAAYELVRRGALNGPRRGDLQVIAGNLGRYFGAIPDVQVIRRLVGAEAPLPAAPPLVRQGLSAWRPGEAVPAPLPPEKLVFEGMWTAWRDAVR